MFARYSKFGIVVFLLIVLIFSIVYSRKLSTKKEVSNIQAKKGDENSKTKNPNKISMKDLLVLLGFMIPEDKIKKPFVNLYLHFLIAFHKKKLYLQIKSLEDLLRKAKILKKIIVKCARINLKGKKFKCGINKFSGNTSEEVVKTHTGLEILDFTRIPKEKLKSLPIAFFETKLTVSENVPLWEPINWVEKGKVSPVDNQHSCGSSWAFAMAGMAESYKAIRTDKPIEKISRQYFLDCLEEKTRNPGSCHGGHYIYAGMWVQFATLPKESDYSYRAAKKEKCPVVVTPISGFFIDFTIHQEVTPEYLYSLLRKGPVAVGIDASAQEFIYYEGGILKYKSSQPVPNHAVLLVGYGKDTDGTEFWLIKNQWGADWGEKGYARIEKPPVGHSFIYTNIMEFS